MEQNKLVWWLSSTAWTENKALIHNHGAELLVPVQRKSWCYLFPPVSWLDVSPPSLQGPSQELRTKALMLFVRALPAQRQPRAVGERLRRHSPACTHRCAQAETVHGSALAGFLNSFFPPNSSVAILRA